MDRLEAYERRAWRLAMLLTGDERAAEAVVQRSLDRQADMAHLPPARLDRLVVQAARQGGPMKERLPWADRTRARLSSIRSGHQLSRDGFTVSHEPAQAGTTPSLFSPAGSEVVAALLAMPAQQREAWIFRTFDSIDPIEASKALDCSRTALDRHLELAKESIKNKLGERTDACVRSLRQEVESLNPDAFVEQRRASRRGRRRWRLVRMIVAGLIVSVVAVAVWLKLG